MSGHAEQCVEKYLELSGTSEDSVKLAETPCMDDHQIPPEDFETKGQLFPVAARISLKVLFLARTNRPDLIWTVHVLARMVTKWAGACDRRLHRLISYIKHTKR